MAHTDDEKTTCKTQTKSSSDDRPLVEIFRDGEWQKVPYDEAMRFMFFMEDKDVTKKLQ